VESGEAPRRTAAARTTTTRDQRSRDQAKHKKPPQSSDLIGQQLRYTQPLCTIPKHERYFIFFFVSGFCSILYEVIWLRLAMAQFGVTTAMVSIVLSAFMGGLGVGSWGSWILHQEIWEAIKFPSMRLYAITDC